MRVMKKKMITKWVENDTLVYYSASGNPIYSLNTWRGITEKWYHYRKDNLLEKLIIKHNGSIIMIKTVEYCRKGGITIKLKEETKYYGKGDEITIT